mgnify:CR=1 FL=1
MQPVRRLVDKRPTYGYRRIRALANRELAKAGGPSVDHKRVFRIMRQNGILLARAHAAKPAVSTMAKSSSCARISAGVRTGSRSRVGTGTSSGSPSSSTSMTAKLSHGMPSAGISRGMVREMMLEAIERRFGALQSPAPL